MTVLVIAEHDHATLKPATLNTVTAGIACASFQNRISTAGLNSTLPAAHGLGSAAFSAYPSLAGRAQHLGSARRGVTQMRLPKDGRTQPLKTPT